MALSLLLPISYFFAYAPFTEGWWHVYARWILEGRVPYRDFELLVPPGYPYLMALANRLGLESFLELRIAGLLLLLAIVSLCWYLLRPIISGPALSIVAATSGVLLQSGVAYISYDYVYVAVFFLLLAFALITKVAQLGPSSATRPLMLLSFLSGISLGLVLCFKQTQGLAGVAVGVLTLVAVCVRMAKASESRTLIWFGLRSIGSLLAGVLLPLVLLTALLASQGAFGAFVDDVTGRAADTKGSLGHLLFAWHATIGADAYLASFRALVPIIVLALVLRLGWPRIIRAWHQLGVRPDGKRRTAVTAIGIALVLAISAVIIYWSLSNATTLAAGWRNLMYLQPLVIALVLLVWGAVSNRIPMAWLSVCGASAGLAWASGMSAGITEIGMFLGVGLCLALFVRLAGQTWLTTLLVLCVFLVLLTVTQTSKETAPYSWWGYQVGSTASATETSRTGLTAGLALTPEAASVLSSVESALATVKFCPGEILQFPHMPLFTLDAGAQPQGHLGTYWLDFSSGQAISEEIQRLSNTRISGLVLVDLPEAVWEGHATLFAGGNELPHRQLYELLRVRGETEMDLAFQTTLPDGYGLRVFTDRAANTLECPQVN
ncbi:MAG: hypothetical protein K9G28_10185 [Candidatus Nanopelagicales bacterium]|nr:hypothetical protein [Candidatus Nanopelagicales bacterium]MCF8557893.1 hypothetical protein [Candidatus Nanopelagicales bacterium]